MCDKETIFYQIFVNIADRGVKALCNSADNWRVFLSDSCQDLIDVSAQIASLINPASLKGINA